MAPTSWILLVLVGFGIVTKYHSGGGLKLVFALTVLEATSPRLRSYRVSFW